MVKMREGSFLIWTLDISSDISKVQQSWWLFVSSTPISQLPFKQRNHKLIVHSNESKDFSVMKLLTGAESKTMEISPKVFPPLEVWHKLIVRDFVHQNGTLHKRY
jgi:hypothetical protein